MIPYGAGICKRFSESFPGRRWTDVPKRSAPSLLVPDDLPDILLGLSPRNHNLMPASGAFQSEIRTDPQHFPLLGSAGMLFLKFQSVSDPNIHVSPGSFPARLPLATRAHRLLSRLPCGKMFVIPQATRYSCAKISPILPWTIKSAMESRGVGVLFTSTSLCPL